MPVEAPVTSAVRTAAAHPRAGGSPGSVTSTGVSEVPNDALAAERKQVTVLFADVEGSMDLAEQHDPEEWRNIMQRFFSILSGAVEEFEALSTNSPATGSWPCSELLSRTRSTIFVPATRHCGCSRTSPGTRASCAERRASTSLFGSGSAPAR